MRAVSSLLPPHNGFSQTRVRAAGAAKVKMLSGFFWAFWPARCVKENSLDSSRYLQTWRKGRSVSTIYKPTLWLFLEEAGPARHSEDPSDPFMSEISLRHCPKKKKKKKKIAELL